MAPLRKSKCKRNMRGGGSGGSYSFAPSSLAGTVANPLAYSVGSSCMPADSRFGTVVARDFGGIPGVQGSGSPTLVGGRRRSRRSRRGRKSQKGGAYSFAIDGTVGGFPGSAGLAGIRYIGPTGPSLSQIPDSGAAGRLNVSQAGGAMALVGSAVGDAYAPLTSESNMAQSQSQSLSVPTAGLTHLNGPASVGASSAGVPYMINVPVDGRSAPSPSPSPSPLKGGRRGRSRRGRGRNSRKVKKSRRSSRRSRSRST